MNGIKELILGCTLTIIGIFIELIATLNKNIYWAITEGYYEKSFVYNLSFLFLIIGIFFIVLSFFKKDKNKKE